MTASQAAPGNRRALIILGSGLGIVVLILVLSRLVAGGGGDDDAATTSTTVRIPRSTTTTTAPTTAPTETFEVFSSKNPFLPLRTTGGSLGGSAPTPGQSVVPGGGGTSTGGTSTGGTGSTGTGSTGTGTGTGTTGTGSGTGTTTGGTGSGTGTGTSSGGVAPRRSERVALLDVFADDGKVYANVRVNDRVHRVTAGETFATSYRVISLSQATGCGRFVFGDDEFRLCEGQEALK